VRLRRSSRPVLSWLSVGIPKRARIELHNRYPHVHVHVHTSHLAPRTLPPESRIQNPPCTFLFSPRVRTNRDPNPYPHRIAPHRVPRTPAQQPLLVQPPHHARRAPRSARAPPSCPTGADVTASRTRNSGRTTCAESLICNGRYVHKAGARKRLCLDLT
jgi:hypothetical protein